MCRIFSSSSPCSCHSPQIERHQLKESKPFTCPGNMLNPFAVLRIPRIALERKRKRYTKSQHCTNITHHSHHAPFAQRLFPELPGNGNVRDNLESVCFSRRHSHSQKLEAGTTAFLYQFLWFLQMFQANNGPTTTTVIYLIDTACQPSGRRTKVAI